MQYVMLFLEGIIVFISPCILPMLPIYLSYFAGDNKKPLGNAICFVIGFTLIFVGLGAFAGGVGQFLLAHATAVNIVAGTIIVLLGFSYLGIIHLPQFNIFRNAKVFANFRNNFAKKNKPLTYISSGAFGIVFAVTHTACVGAFLGAALLRASLHGSMLSGMLMLLVFSVGLGVPFIACALLLDRLKTVFEFIQRHQRKVNFIAGGILIVTGILIMTGLFGRYLAIFT